MTVLSKFVEGGSMKKFAAPALYGPLAYKADNREKK